MRAKAAQTEWSFSAIRLDLSTRKGAPVVVWLAQAWEGSHVLRGAICQAETVVGYMKLERQAAGAAGPDCTHDSGHLELSDIWLDKDQREKGIGPTVVAALLRAGLIDSVSAERTDGGESLADRFPELCKPDRVPVPNGKLDEQPERVLLEVKSSLGAVGVAGLDWTLASL